MTALAAHSAKYSSLRKRRDLLTESNVDELVQGYTFRLRDVLKPLRSRTVEASTQNVSPAWPFSSRDVLGSTRPDHQPDPHAKARQPVDPEESITEALSRVL